mmetsp:Transcript_2230/g.2795  ORF Transcript_2230/g.2795 Transcript_2230/m.2795 type:complete len:226 (+) Transcript_2230:68-745(+)|eukprot:jgi/Bigna1/49050/estExt_Genewise1.C_380042
MNLDETCMDYDHLVKIVMIGDSGVGKTALVERFVEDKFNPSDINTIGVDLRVKTLCVGPTETKVKMQVWDTAGQERFRAITQCYYKNADAFVLVLDLTEYESCKNLEKWINDVQHFARRGTRVVICANKSDFEKDGDGKQRVVSIDDIQRCFSKEDDVTIIETSAKTGDNVKTAFMTAAETALERVKAFSFASKQGGSGDVVLGGTSILHRVRGGNQRTCPCTLL